MKPSENNLALLLKHDSAFSLETIQLHGRLYHAYLNCVGKRTLKAAFVPKPIRWYNYLLWAVTIVPTAILFSLLYYDWKLAWLSPFIQGAIMYFAFRPIAEFCMKKGLLDHYTAVGIVGTDTTQPDYLHAALLRLKWFHDFLASVTNIEKREFERCIEFVELIAKDAPLSWTAYFRHPLPLLLLGIAIFLLNAKIVSLINSTTIAFGNLAIMVGVSVTWAVWMGWLLFTLRHAQAESRWHFLRCLRWTVLSIEQGESKAVVGRAETNFSSLEGVALNIVNC